MDDRRSGFGTTQQLLIVAPIVLLWAAIFVPTLLSTSGDAGASLGRFAETTPAAGAPWYAGLFSELQLVLWVATAIGAAIAAYAAHLDGRHAASEYLGHGSAVSAFFLLDELFAIQESTLPSGIAFSRAAISVAILATVTYIAHLHRSEVGRTRLILLVIAGAAFTVSFSMEIFGSGAETATVIQNGAMLLAAALWAAYFLTTSADIIRSVLIRGSSQATELSPHLAAVEDSGDEEPEPPGEIAA